MFKKKEKAQLNYLELTPKIVKNSETSEEGKVTIVIPRFKRTWTTKLLRLKEPNFNIHLDDFGSATWSFIDGKNKVEDIANLLVEKFGEEIQPVEDRLTKYFSQLYSYKFISFLELEKEK